MNFKMRGHLPMFGKIFFAPEERLSSSRVDPKSPGMSILPKTKGNKIENSLQVTPKKSLCLPDASFITISQFN